MISCVETMLYWIVPRECEAVYGNSVRVRMTWMKRMRSFASGLTSGMWEAACVVLW